MIRLIKIESKYGARIYSADSFTIEEAKDHYCEKIKDAKQEDLTSKCLYTNSISTKSLIRFMVE